MDRRMAVFGLAVVGLVLAATALTAVVTGWGFDWVTIVSEEPPPESTAQATPTATEEPLPAPSEVDFEVDDRYPPGSQWTVFDVAAGLNVRAGPHTGHDILGTAGLGTAVTLTGRVEESSTSGTWVQVQTSTVDGWVFAAYLTPSA